MSRPLSGIAAERLVFVVGLCVVAVGAIGIVAPSGLAWIARRFTTPGQWYGIAAIRVVAGVLLLSVANGSRAPMALRAVAIIPLVAGLATPLVGAERARGMIELWSMDGSGLVQLSAISLLVLGGVIVYACAPGRRAAEMSREVEPPLSPPRALNR